MLVIAIVAQVVEGFIGVFNCDLRTCWGGEKGFDHCVIEMGAVTMRMVGGED